MGGPSGDDSDGGFVSPYSANVKTNTQVNEWSKDDHSIHLKHKDVYPPPHRVPVAFGPPVVKGPQVPGMGPFEKRGAPGGTAMGGPSGNDEGQSFDMSITGIFNTEVNDSNQDDHSIDVKKTQVHESPVVVAPPHPHFNGPHGPPGRPSAAFQTPPDNFQKRFGTQEGGTAMGGPSGNSHHSHGPEGFPHSHGGTAMGGPSGNDGGISFSNPVSAHVHTNVNEFNKDDHSIHLKHKDEFAPRPAYPHFGAPFKRGWGPEHGGTAMGGPSGNDGGQGFSAPTIVNTNTDVNEHTEDNHGIHTKHTDVHFEPHVVPGPGPVVFNAPAAHGPPHHPAGPPSFHGPPGPHGPPHHPDVFAPHNEVYAPHTYAPQEDFDLESIKQLNNGPSAGGVGPFNRRSTDFLPPYPPYPRPAPPPQVYAPYTGVYAPQTYAPEEDFDLEAIKQINNGPSAGAVGPFGRRAVAPSPNREAGGGGGTAMGGPSGDDDGIEFSDPTNVDVTSGVNEHNEDNHSINGDFTHVHQPHNVPYAPYEEAPYQYESPATPAEGPSREDWAVPPPSADQQESETPDSPTPEVAREDTTTPQQELESQDDSEPPREQHEQCSAQVHEVVRTVTKTQYETAQATRIVYQSAPAMETSAVPQANTLQQSAEVDPKIMSYAASASAPASSGVYSNGYNYNSASQRPMSYAASYSMIPVQVPMATPASSGASMATPSGTHGLNMPTGVSAEKLAASSSSASASASASHGVMFTGDAARVSGGLVSAAAAVMGVLAFIV